MRPDSVYGYANGEDVEQAVIMAAKASRDGTIIAKDKLIGDMAKALLEVNDSIPIQSRHRHLVANALENFCDAQTK